MRKRKKGVYIKEKNESPREKQVCTITIQSSSTPLLKLCWIGGKKLLGFYPEPGIEKKQGWLKIFNDLISGGLCKISNRFSREKDDPVQKNLILYRLKDKNIL